MQAFFSSKKFLIGIAVAVIAFIAYGAIFVAGNNSSSTNGVARTDVSASSAGITASGTDIGPGQVFVAQLLAIQSINFKVSLFSDPVFQNLVMSDNVIAPQPQGRDNPFAPFDATSQGISPSTSPADSLSISSVPAGGASSTTSASLSSKSKVPAKTIKKPAAK